SGFAPMDTFTLTANGGTGSFNPRLSSSTVSPLWVATTSASFKYFVAQLASSTADAGAGGVVWGGSSPPASLTVPGLTPDKTLPITVGTAVTFAATASGGTGPYT